MTNKKNKIETLHKFTNLPLSHEIIYYNGAVIKLYGKVKNDVLLNGKKADIIRAFRLTQKRPIRFVKFCYIIVSCDVFSSVSKTWHHISDSCTSTSGVYENFTQIKKCIDDIKQKNNKDTIKNLKFNIRFKSKFI